MSEIKKILVLTQYFSPEPGAPSIRLGQMIKHLKSNDIDISVITAMPNYPIGKIFPEYRGKIFLKESVNGVKVLRVPIFPATGKKIIARLTNYFSFMFTSFLPLLFSKKPDLIFVECQPIILAIPAYIVGKIRNIPYVYNTPDLQVEYAGEDSWVGINFLIKLAKKLETFLMKRSLSVTTVTYAFIKYFHKEKDIDIEKFTFLPNGSDLEKLNVSNFDKEYAEKFDVLGKKIFTFAGTFAPYQGIEVLIDAAKLVQDKNVVFLLAGKGPEKQKMKERVADELITNIKFIDSPFDEMNNLMSITYASIVLLRNLEVSKLMRLSKTFPPLACGVPVIFSGLGESADIIKKTNSGIVTEPENPKKLADAIQYLAENPIKRDQMGLNGREYIEDNLSWSFIVNDWLRQIENIRNDKKPFIPNFSP